MVAHKIRQTLEKRRFSPGERAGLLALAAAVGLGAVDLRLAAVPLTLFVMLCAVAPFLPRAGFFFPVVSRGHTGRPLVALTFDDGPCPATTPRLLDLLAHHRVTATFFVTGAQAVRHPQLIRRIVAQGHAVGNHAFHHNRFRMFFQPSLMAREIGDTQRALTRLGIVPLVFRPPVGITTPAMDRVLAAEGLTTVNYSLRAFDGGNRRLTGLSGRILSRIRGDDIVLLHDTDPGEPERVDRWLGEIEAVLAGMRRSGLSAVPLSRLIDRPVMYRP